MIATPGSFPQEFGGAGENSQTKVPGSCLYLKPLISVCRRVNGQHRKQRPRETPAYPESHGSWCGNLIKQQDFYLPCCPKENRSRYSPCKINNMLNWHSARGYLDQTIQQFGQIPVVLRRLSCQLTFQLSTLLTIQRKVCRFKPYKHRTMTVFMLI